MNLKTIKKLIKLVLLTIIISYTLDKLVFLGLNKVSDKVMTGQSIGKLNQFLSLKDSTDFLVFGNSRANHHIDTELFSKKGYNIGVDGTGIAYSSTLINTLSKDKKQLVVVHLDTKNFFDSIYDGSDIRGLKTKYQRNNKITYALNQSGQLSALQHFYYSMNYNGNAIGIIKNYFRPSYDYKTYNGFDPLSVSKSKETMRDIVLSNQNPIDCIGDFNVNSVALSYLKSIKTFTEASPNKTFIFITTPIYNDNCSDDNEKLAKTMRELGLTYWDFTNFYKNNKNNSLWKDLTHMSKKGANNFTNHLLSKYKTMQL